MSRKWERMVSRNTKIANKRREKSGKKPISADDGTKFMGRSWMLPIVFVMIDVFYAVTFVSSANSSIYWVTIASYLLLALLFWWRRPYLKIGRKELTLRKWSANKSVSAEEINKITLQKGFVIVELKAKRRRWVFSHLLQLYNTDKMAEKLQEFARVNAVTIERED
ncbi:MAG TPA: hypothetical protein VF260_04565 [Bacilli bacterium]